MKNNIKKNRNPIFWVIVILILFLISCDTQKKTKVAETKEITTTKKNNLDLEEQEGEQSNNNKSLDKFSKKLSLSKDDFSDLEFLKETLSDKRVVMLGESSHGVSEYNAMKTRLIKFLHQEMGYQVLAFESPMADVWTAQQTSSQYSSKELVRRSLFVVWHTKNVDTLYDYIKGSHQSEPPLNLVGFDMQAPIGAYGVYFKEKYKGTNPELAMSVYESEIQFRDLYNRGELNQEKINSLIKGYKKIEEMLPDAQNELANFEVHKHFIEDRVKSLEGYYSLPKDSNDRSIIRDKIMAENLDWLLSELYPDQKIIVWAHNEHIRNNVSNGKKNASMGELLEQSGKYSTYTLGLYLVDGDLANNYGEIYSARVFDKNSLEKRIAKSGYPITFLDINGATEFEENGWLNDWTTTYIAGRKISSLKPAKNYDGVIVFNEVSPPEYLIFE
ncbi:erythromycin esterase family protein [Pontibacillus marinus]|uniref:erythromycin esterase family protein n=1 Tax=Pontibacillus marinus TaxID=273164 RepID=UPI000484170A|nr:erythromycin esterase family protein [Pontibacillus marinus]